MKERSIFEGVEGELVELFEGAVAGTEVVHVKAYTDGTELLHEADAGFYVGVQNALRELQTKCGRRQGVALE